MTATDWEDPQTRSFASLIEVAEEGQLPTQRWLMMFHAGSTLRLRLAPGRWLQVLDSAQALVLPQAQWEVAKVSVDEIMLSPRTVVGLVQWLDVSPLSPDSLSQ